MFAPSLHCCDWFYSNFSLVLTSKQFYRCIVKARYFEKKGTHYVCTNMANQSSQQTESAAKHPHKGTSEQQGEAISKGAVKLCVVSQPNLNWLGKWKVNCNYLFFQTSPWPLKCSRNQGKKKKIIQRSAFKWTFWCVKRQQDLQSCWIHLTLFTPTVYLYLTLRMWFAGTILIRLWLIQDTDMHALTPSAPKLHRDT